MSHPASIPYFVYPTEDSPCTSAERMAADVTRPKYYYPRTPIKTPSYYPQSRTPILEDRRVFQRMDIDQLFFIFYYMTGSYEQ